MHREKVIELVQFIWPSNREKWCVDGDLQKLERFAALVEADTIERCTRLKLDADFVFGDAQSDCPQQVRDVIEWYDASIRSLKWR